MELVKLLLSLITSFFQNSTAKKVEEVKLADKTEEATVEKIKSSENATAIQTTQKIQEALDEVDQQQKQHRIDESKKTLDEQLDDQFGSSE